MNEPFVPLNKNAMPGQNRADFRVSIISDAGNIRPFQPLGHAGVKTGAGGQCEPRVTLQRDGSPCGVITRNPNAPSDTSTPQGGRVSAIRIQCGCGQVIELACVYQAAPPAAEG